MAENKETKQGINEQKKQAVIEQLWLTYYNDTLFAKGLITEEQRNKMRVMIKSRTAAKCDKIYRAAIVGYGCRPNFF